ncbi:hypothetical protein SUNI508_03473 [Seiridium unicorne]|uniref:Uncharacterized protein n=1 Tax=Seiridium unicorne TaxID=138068 RepID=A0ABR2VCF5_9PEZI
MYDVATASKTGTQHEYLRTPGYRRVFLLVSGILELWHPYFLGSPPSGRLGCAVSSTRFALSSVSTARQSGCPVPSVQRIAGLNRAPTPKEHSAPFPEAFSLTCRKQKVGTNGALLGKSPLVSMFLVAPQLGDFIVASAKPTDTLHLDTHVCTHREPSTVHANPELSPLHLKVIRVLASRSAPTAYSTNHRIAHGTCEA